MGSISARKLLQIVENVRSSLAIEILTAAAGLDYRKPLEPGRGVRAAHAEVRGVVAPFEADRPLYADMAAVSRLIAEGTLLRAVEDAIGALH